MTIRPTTTILCITPQRLVRADFVRGTLAGLWHQPRPVEGDLVLMTEAALRLGPAPARQAFVLASELWTQTATLGAATIRGLSADELTQALAFEAEALSNVSAFESHVAHVTLSATSDGREFWLTQVANGVVRDVDEVLRNAGARLAGLCHPAGLPRAIEGETVPWLRLEFWNDSVVGVSQDDSGTTRLRILNVDPRQGSWEPTVARWRAETGSVREASLVAGGVVMPTELIGSQPRWLDEEATLGAWLTAWAAHLTGSAADVPLVRPPKRPMSQQVRTAVMAGLAAAVALACLGHFAFVKSRTVALEKRLDSLQGPAKRLSDLERQYEQAQQNLRQTRDEVRSLEAAHAHCGRVLEVQRTRLTALLNALARHCPDNVVIDRLGGQAGDVRVHGLSLDPQLALQLAQGLENEITALGWQVETPRQQLREMPGGRLWDFEVTLKETSGDWTPEIERTAPIASTSRRAAARP